MNFSLKSLLVVVALVGSYLAGLSSGKTYRIVDEEFLRHQLQSERAANAKLKTELEQCRSALPPQE